jgi:hypothetical protein
MDKPGRNDVCPCGSGRKYKKCCQVADEAKAAEVERERQAKAAATPRIDPRALSGGHDHRGCTDPSHDHGPRRR